MPFCEDCAKYYAPSAMTPDGRCPTCGRVLEAPKVQPAGGAKLTGKDLKEMAGEEKAPWHFKLLVAAAVVYLTWRLLQLVGLLG